MSRFRKLRSWVAVAVAFRQSRRAADFGSRCAVHASVLAAWMAILLAGLIRAEPLAHQSRVVIPTRMCGEYFLIPLEVDLDDDGESTTLVALFDTGGNGLHIDPDAVVRAGGRRFAEGKQITIRDAVAGELKFRKLRPHVRELDHISRALQAGVDIFLPFRAFKDYLLTLDFPRREMNVRSGRLPPPDGVEVFDARGPDRRAYLEVEIAGKFHRLLIDSGSSGSISLRPGRDLPWLSDPLAVSVGQGMRKVIVSELGRLDADLDIAGLSIEQPLLGISPGTEVIGTDVMRRFSWTFDQKSRRVAVRPDTLKPLRLPSRRGTGAILVPALKGLEVARVLEGSPADRAGLQAGDLVLAVDGKLVFEQGCERWDEVRRTETHLTLMRDGRTFDQRLDVVDLVP